MNKPEEVLFKIYNGKRLISQTDIVTDAIHEMFCEYLENTNNDINNNISIQFTIRSKSKNKKNDIVIGNIKISENEKYDEETDDPENENLIEFQFADFHITMNIKDIEQLIALVKNKIQITTDMVDDIVNKYIIHKLVTIEKKDDKKDKIKDKIKDKVKDKKVKKKFGEKKEKEKYEQKLKRYTYDKTEIYPKMCNNLFLTQRFTSLEHIPLLFRRQFIVFLFMDGKNLNGEYVRDSLFDKDNEFEIYELLMNSMDESFCNFPDDKELLSMLEKFEHFIPDIELPSMKNLNESSESSDELYEIFKNRTTGCNSDIAEMLEDDKK